MEFVAVTGLPLLGGHRPDDGQPARDLKDALRRWQPKRMPATSIRSGLTGRIEPVAEKGVMSI